MIPGCWLDQVLVMSRSGVAHLCMDASPVAWLLRLDGLGLDGGLSKKRGGAV
jgi:hypothetical protein